MIWKNIIPDHAELLTEHVRDKMAAAGLPAAGDAVDAAGRSAGITAETARRRAAAAGAVAEFLCRNTNSGVVTDEYLLLLVARALWAVGEKDPARQLMANSGRPINLSPHCVEAAFAVDVTLSDWAAFFSSRAVRAMSLRSCGGETLWILDVSKLAPPRAAGLELTMMRALRAALERMAEVWDETGGRGFLGLRHLCRTAGMILTAPAGARKSRRLAGEMRQDCLAWLRLTGIRRRWTALPTLVSMDFR